MKIAIISDIHDNLANLEKCLNYIKDWGAEQVICCGDVCNIDTARIMSEAFSGPIHLVRGNMELFADEELGGLDNIKYYGKIGVAGMGGYKAGFCHEPFLIAGILAKAKCNIIFHGHTHQPWIQKKAGYLIVNPGNLAGVRHMATFAVWETENKEIKLVRVDEL